MRTHREKLIRKAEEPRMFARFVQIFSTGQEVDTSTIYRLLERHGWRKLTPRPYPSQRRPTTTRSF
ncbi:hypothetical protein B4U84_25905 [Westiellopsis prolifica IICB1]|nr:hypothetical protein B4U84_25905 [Westiellopsis prolifica IICB1]